MDNKQYAQKLRKKYMENPPEGYSKAEIERMPDEALLDMDYFLHEETYDLGLDLDE